jgi:hypothetical protein
LYDALLFCQPAKTLKALIEDDLQNDENTIDLSFDVLLGFGWSNICEIEIKLSCFFPRAFSVLNQFNPGKLTLELGNLENILDIKQLANNRETLTKRAAGSQTYSIFGWNIIVILGLVLINVWC